MKKIYTLTVMLFVFIINTIAQGNVGIGTNTPDNSAVLDITSTDKGLLMPRVSLSNVATFGLANNTSTAGMVIYNTNASTTGGAGVGFYYWTGSVWTKVVAGTTATLNNGQIWIGNASNAPAPQTMSGDATISNAGVLDLNTGAVETSEIADAAVTTVKIADNAVEGNKINITGNTNGSLMYYNGTDWLNLAPGTAGQILQTNGAGAPTWVTRKQDAYSLPNTGGTAQWIKVGTLTIPQGGNSVFIRVVSNQGYNANVNQNFEAYIRFKTSNTSSVNANGFAGDGSFYVTGQNASLNNDTYIKWKANAASGAATAYDLFMYLPTYTGDNSFYEVSTTGGTWAHSGTVGTDPGVASSSVLIPLREFNVGAGTLVVNDNVGIGTTPAQKLTVSGDIYGSKFGIFGGTYIMGAIMESKQGPAPSADNQWHTVEFTTVTTAMYGISIFSASQFDGDMYIQGIDIAPLLSTTNAWYGVNGGASTKDTKNTGSSIVNNVNGTGQDNTVHSAQCPDNYIASGIQIWANSYYDGNMRLRCTQLATGWVTSEIGSGKTSLIQSPGGNLDNTTHGAMCPAGTFVKGISAYASNYLDYALKVFCTGIKKQ